MDIGEKKEREGERGFGIKRVEEGELKFTHKRKIPVLSPSQRSDFTIGEILPPIVSLFPVFFQ